MYPNQHIRPDIKASPEPGLGRMIAVSFIVHLAVLGLVSGVLIPRMAKPSRPVYIVDLVNLPVKNPQAGRPDARPQQDKKEKKKPEPPAAKAEPKPEAVKLPPKPEPKPKPTPKETPKAEPKPKGKSTPKAEPKPAVTKKDEQKVSNAIEDLRRRQEMQALKDKVAAMADTRNAAGNAPVGMADGKGTEAGVSSDAWLHEFLKQAWRLSQYQLGRTDLAAEVQLIFDGKGQLLNYKFTEKSGDSHFDDSVIRAILQLKDYPEPTLAGTKKDVVFNLKELLK